MSEVEDTVNRVGTSTGVDIATDQLLLMTAQFIFIKTDVFCDYCDY